MFACVVTVVDLLCYVSVNVDLLFNAMLIGEPWNHPGHPDYAPSSQNAGQNDHMTKKSTSALNRLICVNCDVSGIRLCYLIPVSLSAVLFFTTVS